MNEETIYNPYNEHNKQITHQSLKKILHKFNVYYEIKNIELFQRAFIHKSYVTPEKLNEDVVLSIRPPNCLQLQSCSNERLEFLGDGILENITKFYLYKRFPEEEEGFMTEKKIALVKNDHIGKLAYKMGLHHWYIMSKNAEEKKIRSNYKKLGCLFEAFLGALFLDANQVEVRDTSNYFSSYMKCGIGFQICQIFVEQVFEQIVDWNELLENDDNYKNIFQVMIQKEFKTTPEYVVLNIDEEQRYTMGVYLCLNDANIHNMDVKDAVDFKDIQTFENITLQNHSFIYFTSSSHKIKKKAEQTACMLAIELIQSLD
jgi:dsRNA-specific ribonuclease|tara:strand:+ start:725 stop:1672 length:948 start_codon:yes stop_codon:yes gene_type:complete